MTSSDKILVTGSSGFIGAHVLDQALKAGYQVRAVFRSNDQVEQFKKYYSSYGAQFEAVKIDGSYADSNTWVPVLQGITHILHVASPLAKESDDYEKEIIRPAVDTTTSIFIAAHKVGGIKRIVFTSSIASVFDRKSIQEKPGHVYTDADWSRAVEGTVYTDYFVAYASSKTLAERAAWKYVEEHKPEYDVIAINPAYVFGPNLHQKSASELAGTNAIIWGLVAGGYKHDGIPTAQVHVDDVAIAHVKALDPSVKGGQRFIVTGSSDSWDDAIAIAKANSSTFKWNPGHAADIPIKFDVSKAEQQLGIKWKTFSQQVSDVVNQQLSFYQ